jgi:hypothetical protein
VNDLVVALQQLNSKLAQVLNQYQLICMRLLTDSLATAESFDPEAEYDKKNEYVAAANYVALQLYKRQLYSVAERLFKEMIAKIKEHEENEGKKLNKGIVYANLGMLQYHQNNFDEAIASIFRAHREDIPITHATTQDDAEQMFYQSFEAPVTEAIDERCFVLLHDLTGTGIAQFSIHEFLRFLSIEKRFMLAYLIRMRMLHPLEDRIEFTEFRLHSILRDLGTLYEYVVKDVCTASSHSPERPRTLVPALKALFKGETWITQFERYLSRCYAQATSPTEYHEKFRLLAQSMQSKNASRDERTASLHAIASLVRNYTIHNFELAPQFFQVYDQAFQLLIVSMLYAHQYACKTLGIARL